MAIGVYQSGGDMDNIYFDELKAYINAIMPLPDEQVERLRPHVEFFKAGKGEMLQRQDKRCEYVYCLRQGICRNFVEHLGNDRTRWFAIEGDFFASTYALSTGQPSQSSIEAVTKCELWRVPADEVMKIINSSDEWSRWLMRMLLEGLGVWEKRDRQMISGDAYTRFKSFYAFKPMEVLSQIPLQHVASYLGITPQTLSVCRRRYANEK